MTETIGLIDIGGTSIKLGVWENGKIHRYDSVSTPKTIGEFYTVLETATDRMKSDFGITGIGISSPGAVNKKTGQIEGASAVPYIHHFDIHSTLVQHLNLPITIENDANCAALAEVTDGAGKNVDNLVFMIIGTGIGGAIITNGVVNHGAHLFGGELGYMLINEWQTLSELGSPVRAGERYTQQMNDDMTYSGKKVMELASHGNKTAQQEVDLMYTSLAKAIYNLQYSFDPEKIVLGGAISNNPDLISGIQKRIAKIRQIVKIAPFNPDIVPCAFTDEANLRGAAVDFLNTYPEK